MQKIVFPPANQCIYCGATGGSDAGVVLTREHIVPEFLNGPYILPAASCRSCNQMTNRFENRLAQGSFKILRYQHRFSSKKGRKHWPAEVPIIDHVRNTVVMLPREIAPFILAMPRYPTPGLLGGPPWPSLVPARMMNPSDERNQQLAALGLEGYSSPPLEFPEFLQMLAKIAHSFMIAQIGPTLAKPLLLEIIRGENVDREHIRQFIGGAPAPSTGKGSSHLQAIMVVDDVASRKHFGVLVELLGMHGMPPYMALAGELPWDTPEDNSYLLKGRPPSMTSFILHPSSAMFDRGRPPR